MSMTTHEGAGAGGFLLGLLVGLASGAAAAMLYAPSSGRETRAYLADRAKEGRTRAMAAVDKGREIIQDGREVLSDAVETGREAYRQAKPREAV